MAPSTVNDALRQPHPAGATRAHAAERVSDHRIGAGKCGSGTTAYRHAYVAAEAGARDIGPVAALALGEE